MAAITTLTKKQESKVVAFVAAAREAKSNNKLNGDKVHDNAVILAIANTHKEQSITLANREARAKDAEAYMRKYEPWLCIPRFADAAIVEGIGRQAVRKASGKAAPKRAVSQASGKGVFGRHPATCECVICTKVRKARAAKGEPVAKVEALTVETLAARVDGLDAKLDAILAKLAS